MQDKFDRMFAYMDAKLVTVRACIESYLERGAGKLNNATAVALFRTIENDVIKQFDLTNDVSTHNNLRCYMLSQLHDVPEAA